MAFVREIRFHKKFYSSIPALNLFAHSSFSQISRNWQYWEKLTSRLTKWKQKNPTIKCYPSEYWTWDLSYLRLMLCSLRHCSRCYLGDLRSAHGRALLVLTKLSKSSIEVVHEQKTIYGYSKIYQKCIKVKKLGSSWVVYLISSVIWILNSSWFELYNKMKTNLVWVSLRLSALVCRTLI